MMAKIEFKELANRLQGTYSAPYLDPSNDKTGTSIRSSLATATKAFRNVYDEGQFTFEEYIKGDNNGWLFLSANPQNRNLMRPLISLWIDIILNRIMSLKPDASRRIWLIIDELPALKKIPSLPTALAEFRKYGGCIMAGVQSANQLYSLYGRNEGLTMLDQFNTKIILRTEENDFANYICRSLGEVEYSQASESFSYGAHEMRDGVNFVKQDKKKQLISISDIANLDKGEAYIRLPDSNVRLVKIKMEEV